MAHAPTQTQTSPPDGTAIVSNHHSRYYTTNLDANYLLPSDEEERVRLALQHNVLNRQFSSILIPTSLNLCSGDLILDSGTGSGLWVLDASSKVPDGVIIFGCDVESRLYPRESPNNTTFTIQSILSLPPQWSNRFAFIHQRLLVAALGTSDWQIALREMFRTLVPGGVVRLEEVGMPVSLPTDVRYTSETLPYTTKMWDLLHAVFGARGRLLDCAIELPGLLNAAGFINCETERAVLKLGPGRRWRDARVNFIGVFRGMKTPILKFGGFNIVHSEEDLEELYDRLETEWETEEVGLEFYGFTAMKPTHT